MADEDREYEAGTPLDAEALAFAEKEGIETPERPARKAKDADPDPPENDAAGDDPPDADGGDPDPKPDTTKHDLALKMGWAPREQWRGPADQWVDADTFIDRASPRMLLERIDKLTKEHDDTFARVERVNKTLFERQAKEHADHIARLKRQRNIEVAEVMEESGKEAAIAHGEKWDAHIDAQKAPEAEDSPKPKTDDQVRVAANAAQAWIGKRPQFNTDPVFEAAARRLMDKLKDEMPGQFEAQFAELDKRLAATGRFADIYTTSKPNGGVKVGNGAPPADSREMGGVRVGAKKDTNYASRLPAAARSIGERMVKRGDIKNLEVYAKEYFANE